MSTTRTRAEDANYILGATDDEYARLMKQGDLFAPFTRQFLTEAGVRPGMRVLDVGCGVGDVSLLVADLVGPDGAVVGVDRDLEALAKARLRAAEHPTVAFSAGDFRALPVEGLFDAVVGRWVLLYQADPAAALRAVLPLLRPGGIVAFQDVDATYFSSTPPTPLYDRVGEWITEAFVGSGAHPRMGTELHAAFVEAGLPAPRMRLDLLIGGRDDLGLFDWLVETMRSVLPAIVAQGIATADELGIETLAARLRASVIANQSVVTGPAIVGAWARTP